MIYSRCRRPETLERIFRLDIRHKINLLDVGSFKLYENFIMSV
jgi:hypothetical protein